MKAVPRLAVAVGCLLVATALARGQPADRELARGIRQVEDGFLDDAVTTLDAVARRLSGKPAQALELAQTYLYLGIAYAQMDAEKSARASFREALQRDPGLRLAEDRWPPKVLRAFAAARAEVRPPAPAPLPSPSPSPVPSPVAAAPSPPAPRPVPAGVTIDHTAVACLVAQQFPRLDACVRPSDQVARARVYFRPQGEGRWYYVEMSPEGGCLAAALPRPSKTLVGRRVEYYVDAMDRRLTNVRTPEHTPVVVATAAECTGMAAPALGKANVNVSPSMPSGFTVGGGGGLSTKTVVIAAVVAGGAAAGGLAAAGGGGSSPNPPGGPGTAPPVNPGPAPTTAAPAPTTVATTPLSVACSAAPRQGTRPLTVSFTSSAEGGTGTHDFSWAFGDGGTSTARNPTYTYGGAGTFNARVTVRSGAATTTCERSITVDNPGGPPPTNPPPYFGPGPVRRITWASRLDVPGGHGQVIFHGAWAFTSYPGPGLSHAVVDLPAPTYAASGTWGGADTIWVEAQLVQALDRPGLWAFDLEPAGGTLIRSGSLEVVAGSLVAVRPRGLTFQLQGRPGERVVFTFQSW